MGDQAREVSWIDSVRLQLHLSIPAFLLGLVAPSLLSLAFRQVRRGRAVGALPAQPARQVRV